MKKAITVIFSVLLLLCIACSCEKKENDGTVVNTPGKTAEEIVAEMTEKYSDRGYPIAVIVMENGGTIVLELYNDVAPNTVSNFISLANSSFYDGTIFHRVIPGFMIQGGDPTGTGTGGPGYAIFGEFPNNDFENNIKHERGVISMARQGNSFYPALAYNTAGSQFFIMVKDYPGLNGDYAAFGRVLEGMEVADAIVSVETDSNDKPLQEQKMQLVRVATYDMDYPEPETIKD